jgi:3',5'-cyclic AMP phosphodiesterase CpdA
MATRLATFVHISDLHFGDIDPNTGRPIQEGKASKIWASLPQFDGLLGHSLRALQRLEKFFSQIRQDEDAQLVITGDLTCVGKQDQFDTANAYLGNVLSPINLGLRVANWKDWAVPGNHDRWPGTARIVGGPTQAFKTYFSGRLPFIRQPPPLPTGQQIQFIGIDTDADVSSRGRQRLFALGSFHNQLTTASNDMGIPDPNTIRVLLLHHSYAYRGHTLEMDAVSRQALEVFAVEQDIAVLLCGHTHSPYIKPFSCTHQEKTIEVLEARSGTTLQTDTLPYNWKTVFGNRPSRNLAANTLLVHRVLEENAELVWHAETYTRSPFGFEKRGPEAKLTVWPRP